MALLYSGSTGIRELSPEEIYDPRNGRQTIRRWRGLRSECRTEAEKHLPRPLRIVEENSPWHVLEVTYEGWSNTPNDTTFPSPDSQVVSLYELDGSKLVKSIWDHHTVAPELNKIRDHGGSGKNLTGLARFRADMLALARGEETTFTAPADAAHGDKKASVEKVITLDGMLAVAAGFGADTTVLRNLFDELARGVDSYSLDVFVLRLRSVGPSNANVLPAYLEMNRAIRTDTLKGRLSNAPAALLNVMPAGYWFAEAPILKETDKGRIELFQAWKHVDAYSSFLYGSAI